MKNDQLWKKKRLTDYRSATQFPARKKQQKISVHSASQHFLRTGSTKCHKSTVIYQITTYPPPRASRKLPPPAPIIRFLDFLTYLYRNVRKNSPSTYENNAYPIPPHSPACRYIRNLLFLKMDKWFRIYRHAERYTGTTACRTI